MSEFDHQLWSTFFGGNIMNLRHEMELSMQERTDNPYWRLSHQQLERYEPRYLDLKQDEDAHKERIRLETIRAQEHYASLSVD